MFQQLPKNNSCVLADVASVPVSLSTKEDLTDHNNVVKSENFEALGTAASQGAECSAIGRCEKPVAEAWSIDFSMPQIRRKIFTRESKTLIKGWGPSLREAKDSAVKVSLLSQRIIPENGSGISDESPVVVDSEGNFAAVCAKKSTLPVFDVDGLEDPNALVPTHLSTTRADLEKRFVLRLPRLLCISKQYPRSCGITSLTSIYNYLYSCIGETESYAHVPPISQEEVMTILGFKPPFGEIPWGSFTGNTTLIRWFHALNLHFGRRSSGRAYILYKAHGQGKTTHMYQSDTEVVDAVKKALADPSCALIYHCYNHYMIPVGYQDIPIAQVDFYKPQVLKENCETTIFIGEVSRGRHEAMYARKWSLIKQDIECKSPYFFNIRHPELGVQLRSKKDQALTSRALSNENGLPTGDENKIEEVHHKPTKNFPSAVMQNLKPDAQPVETHASTSKDDADTTIVQPPSSVPDLLCASSQRHSNNRHLEASESTEFRVDIPDTRVASPIDANLAVKSRNQELGLRNVDSTTVPPVIAFSVTEKKKKKKECGNLHCLIAFRNDSVEQGLTQSEAYNSDGFFSMGYLSDTEMK